MSKQPLKNVVSMALQEVTKDRKPSSQKLIAVALRSQGVVYDLLERI